MEKLPAYGEAAGADVGGGGAQAGDGRARDGQLGVAGFPVKGRVGQCQQCPLTTARCPPEARASCSSTTAPRAYTRLSPSQTSTPKLGRARRLNNLLVHLSRRPSSFLALFCVVEEVVEGVGSFDEVVVLVGSLPG